MNYILKSGVLSDTSGNIFAKIKSSLLGAEKKIFSPDGSLVYIVNIINSSDNQDTSAKRKYSVLTEDNKEISFAYPIFKSKSKESLSLYSDFKTDSADVFLKNENYTLKMENSRLYILYDLSQNPAVTIKHRGLSGGWDISCIDDFSPFILCALFIYCRYTEQENEFSVV